MACSHCCLNPGALRHGTPASATSRHFPRAPGQSFPLPGFWVNAIIYCYLQEELETSSGWSQREDGSVRLRGTVRGLEANGVRSSVCLILLQKFLPAQYTYQPRRGWFLAHKERRRDFPQVTGAGGEQEEGRKGPLKSIYRTPKVPEAEASELSVEKDREGRHLSWDDRGR